MPGLRGKSAPAQLATVSPMGQKHRLSLVQPSQISTLCTSTLVLLCPLPRGWSLWGTPVFAVDVIMRRDVTTAVHFTLVVHGNEFGVSTCRWETGRPISGRAAGLSLNVIARSHLLC